MVSHFKTQNLNRKIIFIISNPFSEADTDKSQLTFKKKVLFAEQPEIFESTSKPVSYASKSVIEKQKIYDMTSVVDDDDDWSIESEWTVDNVTTTLKFSS